MKRCSETCSTKPEHDIHDGHVCRLCGTKSYRVKCSYCDKYSCLDCNTIERDLQGIYTKCHECSNVKKEVEMIPCSDCGEDVPLNESNADEFVFDDYEIYCKKCMAHMRELV